MKISKSSLLTLSLIFTTLGLGAMAVSISERQLYINLNNASQYMETVQFISTGSNPAYLTQIGNGSIKIQTNNFILTQTGDNENIISGKNYSSILGGEKNYIEGNGKNIILGGKDNSTNGEYNVILGGEGNKIENGKYSTILGGKNNKLNGNYSVILGSNNRVESTGSIVVGNGSVKGDFSAALGNNSNVEANNSFLWTDGSTTETLTQDNVFVVIAESGMIINTNQAHRFAKLTIGGPLVLSNKDTDKNIQCAGGIGGGILKIENADNQMCLCSCDGSGRNSMLGKGRCMGICDSSIKPQCGNDVKRIKVGDHIEYSGSCNFGVPVKGTGSYLVTKNSKVHWSCQTDDGQVIECSGTATGLPYNSCNGTAPNGEGVIKGNSSYVNGFWGGNTTWTYTENENPGTCEYTCNTANGYHRDEASQSCKNTYNCSGELPSNTKAGPSTTNNQAIANNGWIYTNNNNPGACEFTCDTEYEYDEDLNLCIKKSYNCPDPITLNNTGYCGDGHKEDVDTVNDLYYEWNCGDSICRICTNGTQYDPDEENGGCDTILPNLCCLKLPTNAETTTNNGHGCYRTNRENPLDNHYCGRVGHNTDINMCDYICTSKGTEAECVDSFIGPHLCDCEWNLDNFTEGVLDDVVNLWEFKTFKCKAGYELSNNCTCTKSDHPTTIPCPKNCTTYNGVCVNATCFISGTKVTMSDGSQKNIENVKIGEKVLGSNGSINTVLGYDRPILGNRHLWSINGGEYFVSDEHPFMTTQGWKSFNPEMTKLEIDLDTTELKIGDTLVTNNGKEEIKSIDYINGDYNTPLFNLILDGDHTYHANGYLVHNKQGLGQVNANNVDMEGKCEGGWNTATDLDNRSLKCCPNGYNYVINNYCVRECGEN